MSPSLSGMDTIRVLVATDNHVGYEERDPIRADDSWKTFDEIMKLAAAQDVDMVLLGGDLFHDNKPSRKAMFQVMRSLRKNCLGMKPCELEFLSDANQVFDGAFGHVNYEDPDINISIPVFSIHGNHDDPSGAGNLCSLDLLQVAGLVNYFGRIQQADNIEVKPVLLQKGQTKLALYGLSNVRDERMFRTFRDHKVKWFRPNVQSSDWFNLLTVHQNHHAHTPTSYLPENMLPEWMNLVVWGHEHECLIDPVHNPETGFHVMQPGSSVATSLVPGEAVAKHVAVVSITGRDFTIEKHRLRSVRPFITREIVLHSDKKFQGLEKKKDNRQELTRRLMGVVEEMINEANADWDSIQDDDIESSERPLPLVRLKVEYTAPDGGQYDIENPQRFSNRFSDRVANTNDVVHFYRKKKISKTQKAEDISDEVLAAIEADDEIQVKKLVEEFLHAQSLKVLPQAPFGDAVTQFVEKEDKRAMEDFVSEALSGQVKQMLSLEDDEHDLDSAMAQFKDKLEKQFEAGTLKQARKRRFKPRPASWDSDLDGHWEDQPQAIDKSQEPSMTKPTAGKANGRSRNATQTVVEGEDGMSMDDVAEEPPAPKARKGVKAPAPRAASAKKQPAKGRGRKAAVFEEDDDEEEDPDIIMDEDEDEAPPPPPPKRKAPTKAAPSRSQAAKSTTSSSSATASRSRQTRLNFSQKPSQQQSQSIEISDDAISDDPFESLPATRSRRR